MNRLIGIGSLMTYAATIPAANWLISHAGTECIPDGPCLVPVGFGLNAPSGVLIVGLALVLRDLVQHSLGKAWALVAIVFGALLSGLFAPGPLVVASVVAFLLSEIVDFAIYTPLARRRLLLAVALSGVAGAVVDSAVFLWFAFASFDFIGGQVIGKVWMTAIATVLLLGIRNRRPMEAA